jgi:hypothetical protein
MKKNSLILLTFIALASFVISCEPEYYKPTNPTYKVGDLVEFDGVEAVVYFVSFDGEHGKAIAINQAEAALQWSTSAILTGATSSTDGYFNQDTIQNRPSVSGSDWRLQFPAFYTAFNTAGYAPPISTELLQTVKWYIPSVDEWKFIFEYFDLINGSIPSEIGYKKLRENVKYWTSTEVDAGNVKMVTYTDGTCTFEDKMKTNNDPCYRAIIKF